jgi:hypothetical protein
MNALGFGLTQRESGSADTNRKRCTAEYAARHDAHTLSGEKADFCEATQEFRRHHGAFCTDFIHDRFFGIV